MRLLLLFKTSPETPTYKTPSSFGVQGEVLARGLRELGIKYAVVDRRLDKEKIQAYKDFKPDFVVGIGYWGDVPEIVLHPEQHGQKPVPWLVPDGAVLNYQRDLNSLDLVLATSNWAKEVLIRDGVNAALVKVVHEGVDTSVFKPLPGAEPQVEKFRERFGATKDKILLLTVGGEGKSKGFHEVAAALEILGNKLPDWRYVVKVASSPTGNKQTSEDAALATKLGFQDKVTFFSEMLSKHEQAALFNAADIYASPSHNEGFGRPLVEAAACGKPVLTVNGTATGELVSHGVTGFAAKVEKGIYKKEFKVGEKEGLEEKVIVFDKPKLVEVRADPGDLAHYLRELTDGRLRKKMGEAARKFVEEHFDYRVSARKLVEAIKGTFGELWTKK